MSKPVYENWFEELDDTLSNVVEEMRMVDPINMKKFSWRIEQAMYKAVRARLREIEEK